MGSDGMNENQLWNKFLEEIKDKMSPISFETWFKDTYLYKIENNIPEQFQQGIASVSRLLEELIPVYKRKSDMEKACLAYVFAIFHMTKFQA